MNFYNFKGDPRANKELFAFRVYSINANSSTAKSPFLIRKRHLQAAEAGASVTIAFPSRSLGTPWMPSYAW
jgi:hypothetical protein